jgi:lysophospholipase L1-like esterase
MKKLNRWHLWLLTGVISLGLLELGLRAIYFNVLSSDWFAIGAVTRRAWTHVVSVPSSEQGGVGRTALSNTTPRKSETGARTSDYSGVLDVEGGILGDLTRIGAVIGNAGNPTGASPHNTFLVQPDGELEYVLRPGAVARAYFLRARNRGNLDPPVLYVPEQAQLSEHVERFLAENAVLTYSYTIDAQGHRLTVPKVIADRKILVVGDSVAFGVGVGDDQTVSSNLQQRLGESVQIVNAAVGGYNGRQAARVAKNLGRTGEYDTLVYLAFQNDFMMGPEKSYEESATAVLEEFARVARYFNGRVIIVLDTYMEYTLRDILGNWTEEQILETERMRQRIREVSRKDKFVYRDFTDTIEAQDKADGTIFSRFSLYVDHAHLSPRGNVLLADSLVSALEELERARKG